MPITPPMTAKTNIDVALVARLAAQQFPRRAGLPIMPVAASGWDNRTFHLGTHMTVRLPNATSYALQVAKEQHWLPKLACRSRCRFRWRWAFRPKVTNGIGPSTRGSMVKSPHLSALPTCPPLRHGVRAIPRRSAADRRRRRTTGRTA